MDHCRADDDLDEWKAVRGRNILAVTALAATVLCLPCSSSSIVSVAVLGAIQRSAEALAKRSAEESAAESAGPKWGAEEVPKRVLWVPSPTQLLQRRRTRSTFFGNFLGTPVLGQRFPKRSLQHSLGGDGRQNPNVCIETGAGLGLLRRQM